MLIATPCVNASVLEYSCAAGSPTCTGVNWKPPTTFSCSHRSHTVRSQGRFFFFVPSCKDSSQRSVKIHMQTLEKRSTRKGCRKIRQIQSVRRDQEARLN